jgi:hypothetical protein
MDILKYIPYGRKNAKSRFLIAQEAGISERKFRELVSKINDNPDMCAVIPDVKAGGYYIPKLPDDQAYYDAYIRQEKSRLRTEGQKIRNMEKKKKADESEYMQMSLF